MLRWNQSIWIHQKCLLQQLIQVVDRWAQALEPGRRRPALLISSVEKYSPRLSFRDMIHDHQSSNHDHQDHDYEHCDRQDLNETNLFELSVETQKETLKRLMAMNKVQVFEIVNFCFFFLFTIAIIMSLGVGHSHCLPSIWKWGQHNIWLKQLNHIFWTLLKESYI